MSYYATWNYLRLLITQSQYVDVVRSGHWMWVHDNLNIHQRVRHERSGERNKCTCTIADCTVTTTTSNVR